MRTVTDAMKIKDVINESLKRLARTDLLLSAAVILLNVMGLVALRSICQVAGSDSILSVLIDKSSAAAFGFLAANSADTMEMPAMPLEAS